MKAVHVSILVLLLATGAVSVGWAAGPSEERAKNAFKQVLLEADKNKDGKLSVSECKGIFKDKAQGEKNCGFWDADHDGDITESEYVAQAMSLGRKR